MDPITRKVWLRLSLYRYTITNVTYFSLMSVRAGLFRRVHLRNPDMSLRFRFYNYALLAPAAIE